MRGTIQKKGKQYYAVVYEGIDPGTGKKRRRWVPVRLVFQTALETEVIEFLGRDRYASGERHRRRARRRRHGGGPPPGEVVEVHRVQEIMGHAHLETTERYIRPPPR